MIFLGKLGTKFSRCYHRLKSEKSDGRKFLIRTPSHQNYWIHLHHDGYKYENQRYWCFSISGIFRYIERDFFYVKIAPSKWCKELLPSTKPLIALTLVHIYGSQTFFCIFSGGKSDTLFSELKYRSPSFALEQLYLCLFHESAFLFSWNWLWSYTHRKGCLYLKPKNVESYSIFLFIDPTENIQNIHSWFGLDA